MRISYDKSTVCMCGTIKEITNEVCKMLQSLQKKSKNFVFPQFAYVTITPEWLHKHKNMSTTKMRDATIFEFSSDVGEWFAMKSIETGIDHGEEWMTVISDIEGGGNAFAISLDVWDRIDESTGSTIATGMMGSVKMSENVDMDTIIIAEWQRDNFVDLYEVTETCPHCGHDSHYNRFDVGDRKAMPCQGCGKIILLCSECEHSCDGTCNWKETATGNECYAGKIIEAFIQNND